MPVRRSSHEAVEDHDQVFSNPNEHLESIAERSNETGTQLHPGDSGDQQISMRIDHNYQFAQGRDMSVAGSGRNSTFQVLNGEHGQMNDVAVP